MKSTTKTGECGNCTLTEVKVQLNAPRTARNQNDPNDLLSSESVVIYLAVQHSHDEDNPEVFYETAVLLADEDGTPVPEAITYMSTGQNHSVDEILWILGGEKKEAE